MKKKFLAYMMALCMLVGMMPATAMAAEGDVAKIGEIEYATLAEAFAAANAGDEIELLDDIDMSNAGWTSVDVKNEKNGITIDGNNNTISGLTAPLIKSVSANLTIENLTITGAEIEVKSAAGKDNDTSAAALVQWANIGTLKLNNVSVKDSIIKGDGYVAALVGFVDGTATAVNVTGGEISGNTLTAGGTVGTVAGHVYADVTVDKIEISNNDLTSNSDGCTRPDKVGLVVGRPNAGEVSISATVKADNTVTPAGDNNKYPVVGSIPGGTAIITGGSYPSNPTLTANAQQSASVEAGFDVAKDKDGNFVVMDEEEAAKANAAAKIGEEYYATLAEAIAAAGTGAVIEVFDGTHTMPGSVANKNITFKGGKGAVIEMLSAVGANDSTIAFDGVTVKFDNDNYEGLQHSTKVVYTNCTIIGTQFLYAPTVVFTNCTFEKYDAKTEYNVWTYGATDVTFTDCTFNTGGKAVLVYHEYEKHATIKLTNCVFNSDGSVATDKAAVEVGASAYSDATTYNITFNNCTANNFAENSNGISTGTNLYGNKNNMNFDDIEVIIDGKLVTVLGYVDMKAIDDAANEAKADINALKYLSKADKDEFKAEVDAAAGKAKAEIDAAATPEGVAAAKAAGIEKIEGIVAAAVSENEAAKDEVEQAAGEAKAEIDAAADEAKDTIDALRYLSNADKDEFKAEIDEAVEDAKADINAATALEDVADAKDAGIKEIDGIVDDAVIANKDAKPSKSSGGSSKPTYSIEIADTDNGKVKVSTSNSKANREVTLTVTPDKGYELDKLSVTDKNGKEIKLTDNGDGTYSFTMPSSKVEIDATFEKVEDAFAEETKPAEVTQKIIVLTIGNVVAMVDGMPVANDVAPIIRADRTMLPIRFIAEALGADVSWNEAEQKVTITKGDTVIEIYIGQSFALVNGQPVELDAPAFIENDRTYLPLRFVAEALGATVNWDANTNTVTILSGK